MSLKITGELFVMTMKNDAKFEEESLEVLYLMALKFDAKFDGLVL